MGLFLQHKTEDMQWAVWKMDEPIETLLSLLPDALRTVYKQEMQRFTSEHRRAE